ncbi:hypothetical protein F511_07867 [Dorcoceras hygrometricum]|uniref:F-box domain-containing protein n=1 Tax=Dorcoceras hygrometricum TaxID=472368 RepID=A0A2Z7DEH3_9LAMI|nr:hypothetical protein F511_07867 [Dorcoceras hygrometricum]
MEKSMEEKTMASEISIEESPFNRLPGELIVFIFDKISDAKSLYICSSVPKRFSALVLQTRVVFVKMPKGLDVCSCHHDPARAAASRVAVSLRNISDFLFELGAFQEPHWTHSSALSSVQQRKQVTSHRKQINMGDEHTVNGTGLVISSISVHIPNRQVPSLTGFGSDPSVWPRGKLNFLSRFTQVEYVTLKFSLVDVDTQQVSIEPILRWKCESVGYIVLYARQQLALDDQDDLRDICTVRYNLDLETLSRYRVDYIPLTDCYHMIRYIKNLLDVLPNLNRVSAVDFVRQGRVVIDEEGVAYLRNQMDFVRQGRGACSGGDDPGSRFRMWVVPEVKLSFSRFVLKDVSLVWFRCLEATDDMMTQDLFQDNEYTQVAMRIMEEAPTHEQVFRATGKFSFF